MDYTIILGKCKQGAMDTSSIGTDPEFALSVYLW